MVQTNYQYGRNVFLPYSVGSIQAYASSLPEINNNFQFLRPIFLREDINEIVQRLSVSAPEVAGLSCYLWNWEYNNKLAQAIRIAFPDCLIVFGGPHTPDASDDFFRSHPYVDILVHHEGEFAFADILLESTCVHPDYTKIGGLSVKMDGGETFKTPSRGRIIDLAKLPSPYLSGVFDFMLDMPVSLNVSWETNRGCPYTCTFCDWGGRTYAKIYSSDEERIVAELEWFGRNKVEYVFSCDANFGILKRDLGLVQKMVEIRAKYGGFPKKFRMCTAKKSDDGIFEIVKVLNDADLNKGATLSFQSMDKTTLKAVKRQNIGIEMFTRLMSKYRQAGIATYTELIMGLPGETYESTKKGIDELLEEQPDAVNMYAYVCTMLPNSEMSNPKYIEMYGIKSARMPVLLVHSTPNHGMTDEYIGEYIDVVTETNSMPNSDWQQTYLFYWAVQTFHCLGLLQYIAIFCRKQFGIKYSEFYEKLIEYFSTDELSLIGEEIHRTQQIVKNSLIGGRLDIVMPEFGEICWPLEEASFLCCTRQKERFYKEVECFIQILLKNLRFSMDSVLLRDLILYQATRGKDPYSLSEISISLSYDLHKYFCGLENRAWNLYKIPNRLSIMADKSFAGDLMAYAKEVVWYGRKGGRFHHDISECCYEL